MDSVFIAYTVKTITQKIQNGNMADFQWYLWVFAIGMVLFHALAYMMFRWGYVDFRVKENLNAALFPDFFHIENDFYEKVGTGRSLSIVQKGIDTWATLIQEIMVYVPMSLISFAMSVYIIMTISPYFLLVFVILLMAVGS